MASTARDRILGYICIAGATLIWSVSAALARGIFTGRLRLFGGKIEPIPPLMLSQSRTTIAFFVLAGLMLAFRGRDALKMARRDIVECMFVGFFGIALSNFLYYYAIQQTTVATAIILQYFAPVVVLFYMVSSGKQQLTAMRSTCVALAVCGSVLAIGVVAQADAFPWLMIGAGNLKLNFAGVAAGLGSAVSFSFYNIFGNHLVARHDRWKVLTWAAGGAGAGWMVVNPPWKIVAAHYAAGQWQFMGVFAVFSIVVPFALYFTGLKLLDPTRAIVASCLEPVFAIAIAAFALGELVNRIQVAGIAVTMIATVLIQLPEKSERVSIVMEPIE